MTCKGQVMKHEPIRHCDYKGVLVWHLWLVFTSYKKITKITKTYKVWQRSWWRSGFQSRGKPTAAFPSWEVGKHLHGPTSTQTPPEHPPGEQQRWADMMRTLPCMIIFHMIVKIVKSKFCCNYEVRTIGSVLTTAPPQLNVFLTGTHHRVHLIVSSDVFMQSPQHYHGYHSRQKQHDHQRVHYTGENKTVDETEIHNWQ